MTLTEKEKVDFCQLFPPSLPLIIRLNFTGAQKILSPKLNISCFSLFPVIAPGRSVGWVGTDTHMQGGDKQITFEKLAFMRGRERTVICTCVQYNGCCCWQKKEGKEEGEKTIYGIAEIKHVFRSEFSLWASTCIECVRIDYL